GRDHVLIGEGGAGLGRRGGRGRRRSGGRSLGPRRQGKGRQGRGGQQGGGAEAGQEMGQAAHSGAPHADGMSGRRPNTAASRPQSLSPAPSRLPAAAGSATSRR